MKYILAHAEARRRALTAVAEAPAGYVVNVDPPKRSLEQNAALHALLTEIAERCDWMGQRWDVEDWKRLLTAAWLRARGGRPVMVPALDGEGFDVLYRRTSQMSKAEVSELLDYVQAWAAEHMETT